MATKRLASVLKQHQVPESLDYMTILQSESEDSLALLESTRELMLLESGEYTRRDVSFDLVEMVATTLGQMQLFATSKGVTITFDNLLANGSMSLVADRALVERALENLIKNAVEASNPGGEVRLVLLQDKRKYVVLEVHNGGEPIPEKIQRVLFQPYVTYGKESGSGLGLYAAKLILERVHGWQLDFESTTDRGTIFRILFVPFNETQR
jgi:signal transduction histidine kinase